MNCLTLVGDSGVHFISCFSVWFHTSKCVITTFGWANTKIEMPVCLEHLIQLKYTLKHWKSTFSYSPFVLWWPPLSHLQEKGIFSWPFLGFHIYLKIPIVSLTQ